MGEPNAGERLVQDRIEAALPLGARLYRNVHWIAPTHAHGPARDGEIDALVVHPEHGILVIEVKDGRIERDAFGRWYAGGRVLKESPFRQAETSKYVIREKICGRPDWPGGAPRMLHAIALPEVARSSLPQGALALCPTTAATRSRSTSSRTAGTPATSRPSRCARTAASPRSSLPSRATRRSRRSGRSSTGSSTRSASTGGGSPC